MIPQQQITVKEEEVLDSDEDNIKAIADYRSQTPGNGLRLFRLISDPDSAMNIQYRAMDVIARAGALTLEEVAERAGLTLEQARDAVWSLETRGAISFTGINGRDEWTGGGYSAAWGVLLKYYAAKTTKRLLLDFSTAGLVVAVVILAYLFSELFIRR